MASEEQQDTATGYKFKELKVYASTEWLADNKKKYRQVFDRHRTNYVYAELSFYNKRFDREEWEVQVDLNCFAVQRDQPEKLCSLSFKRKVSKYDPVVYVREGWGNKKDGVFWKKGAYYWEALIEGKQVAKKYFYVEDCGKELSRDQNPFVRLQSIRLYEGQYDDVPRPERTYYRSFDHNQSRYIYAEVELKNKNKDQLWHCELFTKFYNEARELKGQVTRLQTIDEGEDSINITAGWGSNVKGSWRKGLYTVEIVFMDQLLAVVPFQVGDNFREGAPPVQMPEHDGQVVLFRDDAVQESFEEVMIDLEGLIGLETIKRKVKEHAQYIRFLNLRRQKGFSEQQNAEVHSVFIGNPGTGKTTVAGMMGRLYHKMGLLSKGHIHEVDRVDLVGEYIGQTAPKVKEAIEKARGGVLFIDEAYALARANDDSKDFGREVIEMLVKEMSSETGDLVVIVAGYPKEMKHFLNSNPGLKSRFKLYFEFPDYLPQELIQIASYAAREKEVALSPRARDNIEKLITEAYRTRDRTFGNARFVYDIIEKAKINLGLRIMQSGEPDKKDEDQLQTILAEDVDKIQLQPSKPKPKIPIDEQALQLALDDLDALVGMENIKQEIRELVRLVRYYREINRDVLNNFYLHTTFIGNPGTGKTTVARILARIYKALGILERGHMIETDRQGLVAGYVGQTALKTSEKIEESLGGVLFIDEAYSLTNRPGMHSDFGNEVVQTILKRMEDDRGKFFVFAAGYPDNMESFLKANPGLSSRFDKSLKFKDYSPHELLKIGLKMLNDQGLTATDRARQHLSEYFEYLFDYRDKYFGNARTVRNVITEAIKNQHLRLAELGEEGRQNVRSDHLTYDDVKSFKRDASGFLFNRKSIGFRRRSSE